jgi:hypothetical protein
LVYLGFHRFLSGSAGSFLVSIIFWFLFGIGICMVLLGYLPLRLVGQRLFSSFKQEEMGGFRPQIVVPVPVSSADSKYLSQNVYGLCPGRFLC